MTVSGVGVQVSNPIVTINDDKKKAAHADERKKNITNNCGREFPTSTSEFILPASQFQISSSQGSFLGIRKTDYQITESDYRDKMPYDGGAKLGIADLKIEVQKPSLLWPITGAVLTVAGVFFGTKAKGSSANLAGAIVSGAGAVATIPLTISNVRSTDRTNATLPERVEDANQLIQTYNSDCVEEYNAEIQAQKDAIEAAAAAERARQEAIAADLAAKAPTFQKLDDVIAMLRCLKGQRYNCSFASPIISNPLKARIDTLLTSLDQLKKDARNLSMTPKSFESKLNSLSPKADTLKNDCFVFNRKIVARQNKAIKLIADFSKLNCGSLYNALALNDALENSTNTGDLSIFDRQYQNDLTLYPPLKARCPQIDKMVSRYIQSGCGEAGTVQDDLNNTLGKCMRSGDFTAFDNAINRADANLSTIIARGNRRLAQVNQLETYLRSKRVKMSYAGILDMYKGINDQIQNLKNDVRCTDPSQAIREITGKIQGNVAIGALIKFVGDYERANSNPPALEVTAPLLTNIFLVIGSLKDTAQGACVKVEFAYIRNQDEKNAYSYVRNLCYDEYSETWSEVGKATYLRKTIGRSIYNFFAGYFKAAFMLSFLKWLML